MEHSHNLLWIPIHTLCGTPKIVPITEKHTSSNMVRLSSLFTREGSRRQLQQQEEQQGMMLVKNCDEDHHQHHQFMSSSKATCCTKNKQLHQSGRSAGDKKLRFLADQKQHSPTTALLEQQQQDEEDEQSQELWKDPPATNWQPEDWVRFASRAQVDTATASSYAENVRAYQNYCLVALERRGMVEAPRRTTYYTSTTRK